MKIDIKGAFDQMPMKGEPTYMRLDKSLMEHVNNLFPGLKNQVELDGSLYKLMLKAMYGCIQVSALWYALIKKFLEDQGYNILANVDSKEVEKLKQNLIKCFGTVQFKVSGRLSYLGMQIDIMKNGTVIDMTFYVKQILEGVDIPVRALPGTKLTLMVAENAKVLNKVDRKEFHSKVAKLLFWSK